MGGFRLLVVADAHLARGGVPGGARRCELGCELVRRAVEDARRRGGFDAVALMGDLLNGGTAPDAAGLLDEMRAEIADAAGDAPVLVVPGNHDGDPRRLFEAFDGRAGLHEIGGYRFVVFADAYEEGGLCTRSPADVRLPEEIASRPGGPVVALQHNPMNPRIDDETFPFMLTNRDEVMAGYRRAGVLASISGHYHAGQALNRAGGVHYFTAGALCEAPFPYAVVTLRGRDVAVETRTLALPAETPLVDCHAHTEFAYCGTNVTAAGVMERARTFGLGGVCLVEHAPQLYCTAEQFWAAEHVHRPSAWRHGEQSRMGRFRQTMLPLRDARTFVGLEVELDADKHLTLRDEDRDWPDLLVGAVHWLDVDASPLTDAELARRFMEANEAILAAGVDVLAHPWRFFARAGRQLPVELYGELADVLAAADTAAEINWHTNRPDPAFFAACIDRGVRIALGSDAHALWEAGLLGGHVALLRRAGGGGALDDLLWRPRRAAGPSGAWA